MSGKDLVELNLRYMSKFAYGLSKYFNEITACPKKIVFFHIGLTNQILIEKKKIYTDLH